MGDGGRSQRRRTAKHEMKRVFTAFRSASNTMVSADPLPSSQTQPASSQPPLKKRKLQGARESSQLEPSSFEQVLHRLDKDGPVHPRQARTWH
jgi:hypothetical protein